MNNIKTWIEGEILAQKYLKSIGYKVLETNAKLANVEVDIVAKIPASLLKKDLTLQFKQGKLQKYSYDNLKKNAQDTIVFVEVKARSDDQFGMPEEAVNNLKQNHIKRFAQAYVKKNNLQDQNVQFDVVSVIDGKVEHIKNAF